MPTSLPNEFTLSVTLTSEDVELGIAGSSMWCPWARAVARALASYASGDDRYSYSASVGSSVAHIGGHADNSVANYWYASLPPWVETWIANYDRHGADFVSDYGTYPLDTVRLRFHP